MLVGKCYNPPAMIYRLRWLMLTVALGAGWAQGPDSGQTDAVEAPGAEHRASTADEPIDEAEAIHDLVGRLGSAVFNEREDATERLLELGSRAYEVLAREYQASDDYEVRLRIRDIVTRCFFHENLFGRSGFLGVGLEVYGRAIDQRVPEDCSGVAITQVVPDTAAARAGLETADLIVAIDGQPLPPDLDREGFSRMIREAGPGTVVRLSIYRGRRLRRLDVTLGVRPLEYYNEARHLQMIEQTTLQFDRWWSGQFAPGSDPADRSPPTLAPPPRADRPRSPDPDDEQGSP